MEDPVCCNQSIYIYYKRSIRIGLNRSRTPAKSDVGICTQVFHIRVRHRRLEYLHNLSGQPVQVLDHSQSTKCFLVFRLNFLFVCFFLICDCYLSVAMVENSLSPSSSFSVMLLFIHIDKIPESLLRDAQSLLSQTFII